MPVFDFTQSFFQLFQIPESYSVDQAVIKRRYRELQQTVHPDRFISHSDQEKRLAVQYSSWVNEAQQCLLSPVKRAQYLLSLKDITLDATKTLANDPAFLMHQMSLREQLMELKGADDPESELDKLRINLDELIEHQCADYQQSFESADYNAARESVMKMQFLFKLEEEAEQLEAEILDY